MCFGFAFVKNKARNISPSQNPFSKPLSKAPNVNKILYFYTLTFKTVLLEKLERHTTITLQQNFSRFLLFFNVIFWIFALCTQNQFLKYFFLLILVFLVWRRTLKVFKRLCNLFFVQTYVFSENMPKSFPVLKRI